MRRVVTGHRNGKSVILEDAEIPPRDAGGAQLTRLWGTSGIPIIPLGEEVIKKPFFAYGFPQIGETCIQIFKMPPDKEIYEKYTEKAVIENWRMQMADVPFMHTTDTVDYDIVLSGEIWMKLDDDIEVHLKPGDCVVQNGTRHSWYNRGSEDCVMACFLVGAKRATTEYTDTVNKFTFSYNQRWAKNTAAITGNTLAIFSLVPYNCPGVVVTRFPESDAPILKALLPKIFGIKSNPVTATDEKVTNAHGTTANAHVLEYTAPTGNRLVAKVYGFKSGGFWWVMHVYQSPQLGTLDGVMPDEIFNTWRFLQ